MATRGESDYFGARARAWLRGHGISEGCEVGGALLTSEEGSPKP